jgi:hypothetical protein
VIGRTPAEAVRGFRETVQLAVSCVSAGVVLIDPSGYAVNSTPGLLSISENPLRLPGDHRISLGVDYFYRIQSDNEPNRRWRIRIVTYFLTLLDADLREIVAYHWHPHGRSHEIEPHLHLGTGVGSVRPELTKAHLPTGRITLPDVLKLAIDAFAVRPRRRDWAAVLARTRAAIQDA